MPASKKSSSSAHSDDDGPTTTNRSKILLIEDNVVMAQLLKERLLEKNLELIHATNEEEAFDRFKKDSFAAVIIDIPSAQGDTCCDLVEQIHQTMSQPILILFNKEDPEHEKAALKSGATQVIVKQDTAVADIVKWVTTSILGKGVAVKQTPKSPAPKKTDGAPAPKAPPDKTKDQAANTFNTPSIDPKSLQSLKEEIGGLVQKDESEISIIAVVDNLMKYAFLTRASDIHLEPFEESFTARLRVDGILHDEFVFPKGIQPGMISRIKVLGAMRTDEHQAAQDGRFRISIQEPDRQFDVRVSIVPTFFGENAVLRLLAEQTQLNSLDDVALNEEDRKKVRHAAKTPYGMILATGPTGSGKTTTLYTILKELSTREVQIITIEDPVEYSIEGVDQIQVNNQTGLTFAAGLRSILRQDPDIVLVGEIRDKETASIAVNAALTGHKLLSTLHTNDAATTLPRLLDMGVEPFLIASTVNIAIGQRLLRMICQDCKVPQRITEGEFKALQETIPADILGDHRDFFQGKGEGCITCNESGYRGRMGIYEILEMNDFIREAVMRHADAGEIKKIAIKNGMTTLLEDGFQKALQGFTTIEELLRVIHE